MGYAADEVEELIKKGHGPAEISQKRGVSEDITLRILTELVGSGRLRRSDIYYSVPTETRQIIEEAAQKFSGREFKRIFRYLRRKKINVKKIEVKIVMTYQNARIALGDIYQDIYSIEVGLHNFVREVLEKKYGDKEEGWWREGIPTDIRKNCQIRREDDEKPLKDAWHYTDLIDLKVIFDKRWSDFMDILPKRTSLNKKKFLSNLTSLNRIRKLVMHPVRGETPSENDFEFVRDLKRQLSTVLIPLEIMKGLRAAGYIEDDLIVDVGDEIHIEILPRQVPS
jgi:hypothetical protein